MAFGFGFNKAKVLAAAEKNVKQGKLQNAIADYEKIVREDPKDLTVLNTVGDLYARVGNSEQAAVCFRKVGDAYAGDGFTVKAIAMYKKLTKVSPHATDVLVRLAELYTQQGLYNDARYQYTQVADSYLRKLDLDGAAAVLHKMLDLDPENATIQSRLADLYVRLNRKTEARDQYFRSAQALRARGSLEACDAALGRALELDPAFSQALLLRGEVKLELGDAEGAVRALEPLPDLDSRPEALKGLLRALLQLHRLEEAEPVARKLLNVFHDISGVCAYSEAVIAAGDCDAALRFYREHADRLLAADGPAVVHTLHSVIARVKASPRSLEIIRDLFLRAGNTTHLAEVSELLAHAYVQEGELAKARDLYHELAETEPENPLHLQNYRQIVGRLGQDAATRELSPDEGGQAFLVEELEQAAPESQQEYPAEVLAEIKAALTESELFASYNLPARAISPLEAVLPSAPQDVQVNQRLAALYVRVERLADAAARCEVLAAVHGAAGREKEAHAYAELAEKYRARVGEAPAAESAAAEPKIAVDIDPAEEMGGAVFEIIAPETEAPYESAVAPVESAEPKALPELPAVPAEVPVEPASARAHEIDLSEEWERALAAAASEEAPAVEVSSPASTETNSDETPGGTSIFEFGAEAAPPVSSEPQPAPSVLDETLEEARFYVSQAMLEEARGALARAQAIAPDDARCAALAAELAAHGNVSAEGATAEANVAPVAAAETVFEADEILGFENLACSGAEAESNPTQSPAEQPLELDIPAGKTAAAQCTDDLLLDEVEVPAPAPVAQPVTAGAAASMVSDSEWVLGDIFDEFRQEVESSNGDPQDTETRYSMGVAFKDMGLLDEAIGEFQKVCQHVDQGQSFAQTLETYTWLADCFLQKGVPEAAIRWYEKALTVPSLGVERATAIHYELACAQELAGNRTAALRHFMEVYGANIDYRDVAERIKALKS